MQNETLQRLMGVHNILFGMNITGDAIVPMAQALMTLNSVIGEMAVELQDAGISTADDEELSENDNKKEVLA